MANLLQKRLGLLTCSQHIFHILTVGYTITKSNFNTFLSFHSSEIKQRLHSFPKTRQHILKILFLFDHQRM